MNPPSMSTASDARWFQRLLVALALLLAWRLYTVHVAAIDLYFDEAQYWAWSQEPAFGYFSKPPLIAWLIRLTTGMCGDSEFCVRLGAPLLHSASPILIYLAAARLYDGRVGFWSALAFATAPGISFSSALISTDVPLLFFWSGALLAWILLLENRSLAAAAALGICLGLGLLSKYAMVYFVLCAAIWLVLDPESRWLLRDRRLVVILGIPLLFVAPNIAWNIDNGLVTFAHTADNAAWGSNLFHPVRALEFFGAQFGVFGPILFGALIWIAGTAARHGAPRARRMLLTFSLPVLILIVIQALLSRAHANWAAVTYPAAAILVTEAMFRAGWRRLPVISLALHLVVQATLTAGLAGAASIALPGRIDPFWRALGWRDTAEAIRRIVSEQSFDSIVTTDRYMSAELLYYLRDLDLPIRAWRPEPVPRDHFQLTRPFGSGDPLPALLVAEGGLPAGLRPDAAVEVATLEIAAGAKKMRRIELFALQQAPGNE